MATTITPPGPLSTLAEAVAFLQDVRIDLGPTLTETEFVVEVYGKSYSIRRFFGYEHVNPPWPWVWSITVNDNGQWPGRTSTYLGRQWHWETALDTIITDLTRFFPSPDVIDNGLYLWLDASVEAQVTIATSTTDEVEQWLDLSDNGFNTDVQAVSADRPRLVTAAQNGLNVLSFDGVVQHLVLPISSFKDWTLFVVGAFSSSAVTDRGTWFAAMGLEPTFAGMDAYVLNSAVLGPEGTLQTYVDSQGGFQSTTAVLAADTFGVMEWSQNAAITGSSDIGLNGTVETLLDCVDLRDDNFDTRRQNSTEPTPVNGAIGRTNAGIDAGFDFHYLEGQIGEVVLYNCRLSDSEREAVRAGLTAKWGI